MTSHNKSMSALAGAAGLVLGSVMLTQVARAEEPTIITLTQVGCQFVESENGIDHGYTTRSKADCVAINKESGATRLGQAQALELNPGKYIFRVTNKNVPYGLGFYLRGDGLVSRATLPSVSGGGLNPGVTKDYVIDLKPGDYVYSCPLNPTPDYRLRVDG